LPAALGVLALALGAREVEGASSHAKLRLSLAGFDRRFLLFLLAVLLFTLGNSADAFLVLRAQERGLGVLGILGMLAGFNFVYAALATPAGKLSDRFGRKRVLLGGWALYALAYLGFATVGTARGIVTLYTLYGVYYAATEGVARAFVADLVPEARRGAAFGLYHAVVGVAALPASVVAGALWQGVGSFEGLGPRAPFFFGAALALVAAVVLAAIPSPSAVLSSTASKTIPRGDTS
jgi:MFS family permease